MDRDLKKEIQTPDSPVLFFGYKESDYGDPLIYEAENTPRARALRLLEDPSNNSERVIMFENLREVTGHLRANRTDSEHFDTYLMNLVKGVAERNIRNKFSGEQLKNKLKFIKSLNEPGQLFRHMSETRQATVNVFKIIKEQSKGQKVEFLTDRQTDLMEFVAATHDLFKLLGDPSGQIDPDHEVIYKNLMSEFLPGKKFTTHDGRVVTFSEEDAAFCVGVAGFHEDIYREKYFAEKTQSLFIKSDPSKNLQAAINRAIMVFHITDIFGVALGADKNGLTILSDTLFEDRFIDLYRRHVRIPIKAEGGPKEKNWARAKAYRPQWGLHGVSGLTWTLNLLQTEWGVKVNPNFIFMVQKGVLQVLGEAIAATRSVISDRDSEYSLIKRPGEDDQKIIKDIKQINKDLLQSYEVFENAIDY